MIAEKVRQSSDKSTYPWRVYNYDTRCFDYFIRFVEAQTMASRLRSRVSNNPTFRFGR